VHRHGCCGIVNGTLALSAPTNKSPRHECGGHTVAAAVLSPLVEVVKRWSVSPDDLLGTFGLSEGDIARPQSRLSLALYISIIERARTLTGEPGLGFGWGLQMRVSTLGYLGFATMSAATLGDAIALASEFASLASTAEPISLKVEGGIASLILDELADFGSVNDVVTVARLTGFWRIAETVTGRSLHASAEVAFPEPPYFPRFARLVPPTRFGQPTTRALMPAEVLGYPLIMASTVALRLANEQCERELQALSSGGPFVETVRNLLVNREGTFRSARQVADAVGMSPRTLRRKLALHGSSLSTLFDRERRDQALLLLRLQKLSLADVAERLDYGNVQTFVRAFQRWTGVTPAAYRRTSGPQAV
jgi:AraC-like DNA-binding protein